MAAEKLAKDMNGQFTKEIHMTTNQMKRYSITVSREM